MSNYRMLGSVPLAEIIALLKQQCPDNLKETLAKLDAGGKRLNVAESKLLDQFLVDNYQPPAPPAPEPPAKNEWKDNEEYNRRVIEKASQIAKERFAATSRLGEWQKAGLLETPKNTAAINKFLMESPELADWRKGERILTPSIIDVAVKWLYSRNELDWKPKETPAPAAPVVAAVKLSDGTDQLPLGTAPSYRHSKAQLADLARREAQAKSGNRHGWHGGGRI